MKKAKKTTKNLWIYPIVLFFILSFQYCSKSEDTKVEIKPTPTDECDLTNVTFSVTVMNILSSDCTSCHSASNQSGGIRLDDYASVKAQASIAAGSAGSLMGAISHTAGNSPMPKNGSKLSDCKISQINKWIQNGMPNN